MTPVHHRALVALLATAVAVAPAVARGDRGGPDRYGYEWVDSDEAGEVTYEWVEVAEEDRLAVSLSEYLPGSDLPVALGTVRFGFDFDLYGMTRDQATVLSFGALLFEPMGMLTNQCPLPNPWGPNGGIYGFVQALDPLDDHDETGAVRVWSATVGEEPDRRFVIAWEEVTVWRGVGTPFERDADAVAFQIVIYEGTNEIQVNVRDSGALEGGGAVVGYDTIVGIESRDGSMGTGVCGGEGTLPDEHAIRFRRSEGVGLFPPSTAQSADPGEEVTFELEIRNFGPSEQGWSTEVGSTEVTAPADGVTAPLSVTVRIPADAPRGGGDEVTLRVRIDGEDLEANLWIRVPRGAEGWSPLPPLPMALDDVVLVAAGGGLLALGGALESDTWAPVDAAFSWEPGAARWSDGEAADLPHPVAGGDACLVGDRVYYVGGYRQAGWDSDAGTIVRDYAPGLLVYDLESDLWQTGPPPPRAVTWPALACDPSRGRLYVAGGVADVDGDGRSCCSELGGSADAPAALLQIYDVSAERWELGPAPPNAFTAAAGGFLEGRVIVAGGYQPLFGPSLDTRIFDVEGAAWTFGARLDPPRTEAAGVILDGELCLLGGRRPSTMGSYTERWECFDGRAWALQEDPLPSERASAGAAVLDGRVYVAGGQAWGHALSRGETWPTADPVASDGDADGDGDSPDGGAAADGDAPDGDTDGTLGGGSGACGCAEAGRRGRVAAARSTWLTAALPWRLGRGGAR